jgi:hypothetical protein
MPTEVKKGTQKTANPVQQGTGKPQCLEIAKAGISTGSQFATFMSRLMSDLIEGSITPQVGNAAVNAGGKLLKVVEMQYRYGKSTPGGAPRPELNLLN